MLRLAAGALGRATALHSAPAAAFAIRLRLLASRAPSNAGARTTDTNDDTTTTTTTTTSSSSSGTLSAEEAHDDAGSLAHLGMVVQPPLPGMHLPDPAAPDAPMPLLQRLSEAAQDLFRPAFTAGHAYHYAEDSARAVLEEQQQRNQGIPGIESMYAPEGEGEVGDMITAPRNWQFSNQGALLDEKRQAQVAAQNKEVD